MGNPQLYNIAIYEIPALFVDFPYFTYMAVSWKGGTPKSSILVGFRIIKPSTLGTLMTMEIPIYIVYNDMFHDSATNKRDLMVDGNPIS